MATLLLGASYETVAFLPFNKDTSLIIYLHPFSRLSTLLFTPFVNYRQRQLTGRTRICACVRACVRARALVCECMYMCVCSRMCVFVCSCDVCVFDRIHV